MYFITRSPYSYELSLHKITCFHRHTATPDSRIKRVRTEKAKKIANFKKFEVLSAKQQFPYFQGSILFRKFPRKGQMDTN